MRDLNGKIETMEVLQNTRMNVFDLGVGKIF